MPTLNEYISRHCATYKPEQDLPAEQVSDLIFFKMRACGKPDAEKIREAIKDYRSNNLELDLFDGKEHSYIQIGAWLGDQGEALMLMGLGSLLGFWKLLTPYTVLGDECPEAMAQQMAGRGMITIRATPVTAIVTPPSRELFGTEGKTARNFPYVEFKDEYGKGCSIQESSRAVCENEDGSVDDPLGWIWLGIDDAEPQIMKTRARELGMELPPGEVSGWMPFPLPDGVNLTTRMHLNEQQVRGIIERLTLWLETGALHKKP